MKKRTSLFALAVAFAMAAVMCSFGCSSAPRPTNDAQKVFRYGTTGYGVEMDDVGLNPHSAYSGWSAVRYGVGETLFRFSDSMEAEPWLAKSYDFVDDTHVRIELRDDVTFTSGRKMDATAVKECLDDLVATHDRAPQDLKIEQITTEDNAIVIETKEPCPALINYLCDPYGAIIDMQAGVTADNNVSGTGPYVAQEVSDTQITLTKNDKYWGDAPKVDTIVVSAFSSTDALQSALQSGEIDATYGLAYASYPLFQGSDYHVADCFTSRVFFGQANFAAPIMQDDAVRRALALGIPKEAFVQTLLSGRGKPAKGPFPTTMKFGDDTVTTETYDPEAAKTALEQAGWVDSDGDGIREKDGQRLTIRWLTYPGRLELPLLAESSQAALKEIGMDVQVNSTSNHTEVRKDKSAWDVYVSALTTAPTGDPEYFFGATCLDSSTKNFGGYHSDKLEGFHQQLRSTFDPDERARLAIQMSQTVLDDHGFFFASFLQMGIVSKANVTGIAPHPCDYYEITADLDV